MLGVKLVVVLCTILGAVSAHYGYYHHHHHRHHHVACWGKYGCIRRGPPICEKWCLVVVRNGICQQVQYQCCSYREKPGFCPAVQPTCAWPFPYFSTKYYECSHDYNCPTGYKCCQDSCFAHKICRPCTYMPPQPRPTTTTTSSTSQTPITTQEVTTEVTTTSAPEETTTSAPEETTTEEITTTSAPEETTTEEITTTSAPEGTTTVEITTTLAPEATITEEATTTLAPEGMTTEEMTTTSQPEESTTETPTTTETSHGLTTTRAPVNQQTTTEEFEASGSGDDEVPEPHAARMLGGFVDDEDLNRYGDYVVY